MRSTWKPTTTVTESLRILGVDPGLHVTGYGCIELLGRDCRIVEAGAVRTDAKAEMPHRLAQIRADLAELLAELRPHAMAVEKLYAHYAHPRTSILMGHARGVILLVAQEAGLGVRNVAATEVKKSLTGNGHASKEQMQAAIQSVCNLPEPPSPPDVADAIAIALCAVRRL